MQGNKQRTPTKWISAKKLFKAESSLSPMSIRFPTQETIIEREKSKPHKKKKKNKNKIKFLPSNK